MKKQAYHIRIEKDLRPSYYDSFHCLAESCKISCCKGWRINFDKDDYLSLKAQRSSSELEERIAKGVRRIRKNAPLEDCYAEFVMKNGDCPLLREDCLCQLQIEHGHDVLPKVCQQYPRAKLHMPSGYLERSLAPSCEGVLALLWECPGGIDFLSDPIPVNERATINFSDKRDISVYFQDIRSWCIDLLQNRQFPLPERILRMGMALKTLSGQDVPQWLEQVRPLIESKESLFPNDAEREALLPMFLVNNLQLLLKLQSSDHDFHALRSDLISALLSFPSEEITKTNVSLACWRSARTRFDQTFGDHDYFMENVLVAIFFHLHMPLLGSDKSIWKSFVNLCNLYSFYRFMMVMSCREGSCGDRDALFRSTVHASRALLHNGTQQNLLRDEFFKNDSASLAHMAILLSE